MFEPDLLSGRVPIRPRRTIEKLSDTVSPNVFDYIKERIGEIIPEDAFLSDEDKKSLKWLRYDGRANGTMQIYDSEGNCSRSIPKGTMLEVLVVKNPDIYINPEKNPISVSADYFLPTEYSYPNIANIPITFFVECINQIDCEIIIINRNVSRNFGQMAITIPPESNGSFSMTFFPKGGMVMQNIIQNQ